MPQRIRISSGEHSWTAELNESRSAKALLDLLPTEIAMNRWGDEYYGGAGLELGEEPDARTEMEVGELAVWPDGQAVCIFFGSTPASHSEEPRAASNVNPIGRLLDDPTSLKQLGGSITMRFEREG
ncbi:MAG: hypothetical protein GF355_07640 [Candidatus Eisenbacteria bacterium]|nr:hypothetical protein [Candidatus Eisenbacteria bacterium]